MKFLLPLSANMRWDEIPKAARPIELAVLLFYDPLKDNKKEAAYYAHCSVRTAQKVVQQYKAIIQLYYAHQDGYSRAMIIDLEQISL